MNDESTQEDFLDKLDFGDHIGLVTYDETSRVETTFYEPSDGASVDISATPITDNYAAIDTIERHKQDAADFDFEKPRTGRDANACHRAKTVPCHCQSAGRRVSR
jgi:hypothetical protein